MSLAISKDGGLSWHDTGRIITGKDSLTPGKVTGEGDCSALNGQDGYYYAYCGLLKTLLQEDGKFDDEGVEARQVGIVSVDGRFSVYTGQQAAASLWAGSRTGDGYSIQGNGLVGPQVVEAMEKAFKSTPGALAERLMAALIAGDNAGGQKTGRESSALLVSTPAGFPMDIDLRVDHSSDPVGSLRLLLNIQTARQQIVQARIAAGKGHLQEAKTLLISVYLARRHGPVPGYRPLVLREALRSRTSLSSI